MFDGLWHMNVKTMSQSINHTPFIQGGKKSVLRGSGAKVARGSLGGVLSPLTPASSAFLFPEPLEYDFSMTAGALGVRRTDAVGIVGVDL